MLDPARSFSVTASAGTGKTHQLVSRVVRLLLAGAEPGSILAVTFTRKAAAEMGERVSATLRELDAAAPDDLERRLRGLGLSPSGGLADRARALHERLLFEPFPLRAMTLHAFCQDLLSRFALEAGVPPGFRVIESEELLLEHAWERLVGDLSRDPRSAAAEALLDLTRMGDTEPQIREAVIGFLQRRSDWWMVAGDAQDPVRPVLDALRRELGDPPARPSYAALDAGAFSARLTVLYRWLEKTGGVRSLKPGPLGPALAQSGAERFATLCAALCRKDGEPYELRFTRGQESTLSDAERRHIADTHAQIVRALLDTRERIARAETLRRNEAGLRLGAAALGVLEAMLREQGALTFADLEWRAWRLLGDPDPSEWVRYKLDRRIDHLLVDEFQDTSPTQWQLLLPLLEEMAAGEAGRARSVFLVGDAKQSIFGFRRADPGLLAEASGFVSRRLGGEQASLVASRRSAPAIIRFVNELFAPADLGGAIGFVPHDTVRTKDWGRVEVAPLIPYARPAAARPAALRRFLTQPRPELQDPRALQEAALVAERIRALVASRVEVVEARGDTRPIQYGDVMVLARSRTHLDVLERALVQARIPFAGAARGTLLESAEGGDLWALLRFLNSPVRDLDLAQALRSPLFGAGDGLLVELAASVRERGGNWYEALARAGAQAPEGVAGYAAGRLARWLAHARRMPAHDLLDRICSEGDVAARYEAGLPEALRSRVRPNLGALVQLALEADHGRYPTLARFLEFLEDQSRLEHEAPGEAPPALPDHVRIMTIHAAKGLEAPAVFLVNAGAPAQLRAGRWLVEWPHGAPRPTHFVLDRSSGARDALCARLAESQLARDAREELHLLYVAVTRARQFLFISGFESGNAGERLSWHDHAWRALETLAPGPVAPLPGVVAGSGTFGNGAATLAPAAAAPTAPLAADARLLEPLVQPAAAAPGPDDAERDPEAVRRGRAVHALLQRLAAGESDPEVLRPAVAGEIGPVGDDEFPAWLAEATAVLAAPDLARFFDPARVRRAWNEAPLLYPGPDGPVPGVMDRLVDDGEVLWILDYKTSPKPDAAGLAERYRAQIERYAEGVRQLWPGRPVRGGLVLTATRAWVPLVG